MYWTLFIVGKHAQNITLVFNFLYLKEKLKSSVKKSLVSTVLNTDDLVTNNFSLFECFKERLLYLEWFMILILA